MSRYILRFRGQGGKPDADVNLIKSMQHLTILDDSARMLLVEASEGTVRNIMQSLTNWVLAEEQIIPAPDSRPRLRGKGVETS